MGVLVVTVSFADIGRGGAILKSYDFLDPGPGPSQEKFIFTREHRLEIMTQCGG